MFQKCGHLKYQIIENTNKSLSNASETYNPKTGSQTKKSKLSSNDSNASANSNASAKPKKSKTVKKTTDNKAKNYLTKYHSFSE